jgi:hypothetical protein
MDKINVKAILLDFGGTLAYTHRPTWNKYEKNLLSTLQNHGHPITLDKVKAVLDKLYIGNTQGAFKDFTQYWITFIKQQNMSPQPNLLKNLETFENKQSANSTDCTTAQYPHFPNSMKNTVWHSCLTAQCAQEKKSTT